MLEYRVLGPLTALVDGRPVKLGGRRPQLVLATLLSHANLTVSQDSLIDSVWAGDPPEAAKSTLQSYVYGLRRVLGADAISRRGEGYLVEVDVGSFDSMRFEELVTQGRGLMSTDPTGASNTLAEGLALWNGAPYEGLESNPGLLAEIARLEELRLTAIEARIEAELTLGNDGSLVGELDSLVRDHPLRERFRAQQMLALYRSGRQAESLRAYQHARLYLAEQLGIEPSLELQDLEQRILEQDRSLAASARSVGATAPASATGTPLRGYEIKGVIGTGDFGTVYRAQQPSVQREVAIKVIRPEYANEPDFVQRFEREAQTVAQLDHPHIVPLYDYWRDPEGAYLVMPLMRGGSLDAALGQGGWSLPRVLTVIDDVCGALIHAHRRGVVHRDVKPANVLLDSEGNAYLSDFGIAQFVDGPDPDASLVTNGGRRSGDIDVAADIMGLGSLAFQLLTGVHPVPGWPLPRLTDARPDLPPELGRVLTNATGADPAATYQRAEDFFRAFKQTIGADVVMKSPESAEDLESIRNPYKGLRAFRDSDAGDFFGRDALVDELLGALSQHNVVTVVGPSGSGKSSLVRAGLIPALREGAVPGSGEWLITDMFPGSHPFEELEAALLKVAVDHPSNLLAELADERGLLRVTKRILPSEDTTLLLLVDQFEELFSTVRSESRRRAFLDNLVAVASDERSRVKVVVTLRADYLDRPLAYRPFADVLGRCLVTVGPPSRDGLAQAISAPARSVGVEAEPGLIGRIISDVESQPGALPLLQFALTELFETRDAPWLTITNYEAMGGVQRALGSRAEELYAEMPESMRESARQIFLRLVNITEENEATRRRVSQSELRGLSIDEETIEQVLGRFGRLRLISFDREPLSRTPTVELAHEAILDEWDRLRVWIDEHREALIAARRISGLTREWVVSGRDASFLLRGSRLRQTEAWLDSCELALTDDEQEFIAASLEAEESESRVRRRRRSLVTVSLAAALGTFAILAFVALWQWDSARTQAREATVRDLATDSAAALDQDPELALLLAVESAEMSLAAGVPPNLTTRNALVAALQHSRLDHRLDGLPRAVEFAGPLIVTISPGGSVEAQSAADGTSRWTVDEADAHEIAASPDGALVAVATRSSSFDTPSELAIWTSDEGEEIMTFPLAAFPSAIRLAWSEDGRWLTVFAKLGSTSEISTIDVPLGEQVGSFTVAGGHDVTVLDGDTIAVSNPDAAMVAFFAADGSPRGESLQTPGFSPGPMAFDPTDDRLILGAVDGKRAQAWDLASREMAWETILPHPGSTSTVLALSAEAGTVAIAAGSGAVTLYELDDGTGRFALRGHLRPVDDLEFDATGGFLVTAGEDDGGRLWNVTPGGIDTMSAGPEAPCAILLSPDGSKAVMTGTDGTFTLVDLVDHSVLRSIPGQHIGWDSQVAVSEDWRLMGWVDHDGVGRVWDVIGGEPVLELPPCHVPRALSHDGSLVVTRVECGGPTRGSLLNTTTGEELLDLGPGEIWTAQFTSGGGGDRSRYAVILREGVVEVFDTGESQRVGTIEPPEGDIINAFDIDVSGLRLVAGTERGLVSVYALAEILAGNEADEAVELRLETPAVAVGVAVDGPHLAVSSHGSLSVWDIQTGELLYQPPVRIETPPFTAFSSDGSSLMFVDGGYELRWLTLDPEELVQHASHRLTRGFTEAECNNYLGPELCGQNEA